MATLGIAVDKAPKTVAAFRSDGQTIPWIAAGGEAIGDIATRVAGQQAIGLVSSLKNSEDTAATAGDEIHLRIDGMIYAPIADGTYNDGDLVSWGGTNFGANATGAHEIVGGYVSGDTHALVRMNIVPRAAT